MGICLGCSLVESKISLFLPHKSPMLLLDAVSDMGENTATVTTTFMTGEFGSCGSNVLESVLIECVAQAVAFLNGYEAQETGRAPAKGMLVGIDNFECFTRAQTNIELHITVRITNRYGSFCFAEGIVKQNNLSIAKGNLKFYIVPEGNDAE